MNEVLVHRPCFEPVPHMMRQANNDIWTPTTRVYACVYICQGSTCTSPLLQTCPPYDIPQEQRPLNTGCKNELVDHNCMRLVEVEYNYYPLSALKHQHVNIQVTRQGEQYLDGSICIATKWSILLILIEKINPAFIKRQPKGLTAVYHVSHMRRERSPSAPL